MRTLLDRIGHGGDPRLLGRLSEVICVRTLLDRVGHGGDPSCTARRHFRSWLNCFEFVLADRQRSMQSLDV